MALSKVPAVALASGAARTNFGTGAVLQVVSAVTSTNTTTTSSTPTDMNLGVTITPSSATSKILVLCNPLWSINGSGSINGTSIGYIYRNGTSVYSLYNRTYNYGSVQGIYQNIPASLVYLDAPATTSAVTYKFYLSLATGYITQIQGDGGSSSITVMEIAA